MRMYWLFLLALGIFPIREAEAQFWKEAQMVGANYAVTLAQVFLGKVIQGENVFSALTHSLYESAPAAGVQYAGMRLVGANWQLAIPGQLLVQKGAQIQREAILGESIFSRRLYTSWELDYLWFNFRVSDKRLLPPRLNVATLGATALLISGRRFRTRESLTTGTVVMSDSFPYSDSGHEIYNVVVFSEVAQLLIPMRDVMSHEFEHVLQRVRGVAFTDPLLWQDASQRRPLSFFRLDVARGGADLNFLQRLFFGRQPRNSLFSEWEAAAYSGFRSDPYSDLLGPD